MELNTKHIHILEVAEKLFAENSFDGTSVRQIAKMADVNVAMISYYFGSKEKMLEELLKYRMSDFRIQIKTIISKEISYPEKVDAMVAFVVTRINKNRRMHKIIHFEYSNDSRKINFENYIEQKQENYKVIEAFVKKGQEEGIFSKKVNIALIVPTILGTYFHFYYNKRFYQNLHNLNDDLSLDEFVHTTLTKHIQQTIKALLTHAE